MAFRGLLETVLSLRASVGQVDLTSSSMIGRRSSGGIYGLDGWDEDLFSLGLFALLVLVVSSFCCSSLLCLGAMLAADVFDVYTNNKIQISKVELATWSTYSRNNRLMVLVEDSNDFRGGR